MADKPMTADANAPLADAGAPAAPVAPRRPPGHRSTDVRDTVAEMAARAQEISQEAGSKVAAAMKDVIGAAAGLAAFAIESARDLVPYIVRRGQMTQEEADKLMREAEEAYSKRPKPPAPRVADVPKVAARAAEPAHVSHTAHAPHAAHASHAAPAKKATAPAKKPAKPAAKPAAKSASKSSSKSGSKSVKAAPKKASKPASAASRSKLKAGAKKRK
jgi:polyhydroxyalkanoate synthesis regulator phasin